MSLQQQYQSVVSEIMTTSAQPGMGRDVNVLPCRFILSLQSPSSALYTQHFGGLNQHCAVAYAQRNARSPTEPAMECVVSALTYSLGGNSVFFGPDAILVPPGFAAALSKHNALLQQFYQQQQQHQQQVALPRHIRYLSFAPTAPDQPDRQRFFISFTDGTALFSNGESMLGQLDGIVQSRSHDVETLSFGPDGSVVVCFSTAPFHIVWQPPGSSSVGVPAFIVEHCCSGQQTTDSAAAAAANLVRAVFLHPLLPEVYVCQFQNGLIAIDGTSWWTPEARAQLARISRSDLVKSVSFGEAPSAFLIHVVVGGCGSVGKVIATTRERRASMESPEPREVPTMTTVAARAVVPRGADVQRAEQQLRQQQQPQQQQQQHHTQRRRTREDDEEKHERSQNNNNSDGWRSDRSGGGKSKSNNIDSRLSRSFVLHLPEKEDSARLARVIERVCGELPLAYDYEMCPSLRHPDRYHIRYVWEMATPELAAALAKAGPTVYDCGALGCSVAVKEDVLQNLVMRPVSQLIAHVEGDRQPQQQQQRQPQRNDPNTHGHRRHGDDDTNRRRHEDDRHRRSTAGNEQLRSHDNNLSRLSDSVGDKKHNAPTAARRNGRQQQQYSAAAAPGPASPVIMLRDFKEMDAQSLCAFFEANVERPMKIVLLASASAMVEFRSMETASNAIKAFAAHFPDAAAFFSKHLFIGSKSDI